MSDILTAITSFAVSVFRAKPAGKGDVLPLVGGWSWDDVLEDADKFSLFPTINQATLTELVRLVFSEPDLAPLDSRAGELDSMMVSPFGAMRVPPANLERGDHH